MNNFSKSFSHDSKILFYSKTISYFGNGFSKFVLPLFVYEISKNPTHVGMQWAIIALTQLLATYLSPRIKVFKNDKTAVIILDLSLMLATLIPVLLYNSAPVAGTYISSFLITFISTVQSGYLESLLGHSFLDEKNIDQARNHILGNTKVGENLGQLLGFSIAGIISQLLGFKIAFYIDAITFLVSALLLSKVYTSGQPKDKPVPRASFSLIFGENLKYLSLAQICAAFATFIMNGIWIVTLKSEFNSSNIMINSAFILQFVLGFLGAKLFTEYARKNIIQDRVPFYLRSSYVFIFLLFALSNNAFQFITVYGLFSFIIAFSLPAIQGMFQRGVKIEELRGVGTARIALNSIAGAIAAAGSSTLLNYTSSKILFLAGAIISLIGAYFFWKHISVVKSKI